MVAVDIYAALVVVASGRSRCIGAGGLVALRLLPQYKSRTCRKKVKRVTRTTTFATADGQNPA